MDENNILLERLQANDEAAYQELFEIYFKQLHHFAERMVFDSEVAHDLVPVSYTHLDAYRTG